MRIARKVSAFLSAVTLSISSHAATLMPEHGIVLINRGNGYVNATGPTTVNPGDVVVVNPGGLAWLQYPDGCLVPVLIGAIVTVGQQSPCTTEGSMTPSQAAIPPDGSEPPPEDSAAPSGGGTFGLLDPNVLVPGLLLGGVVLGVAMAQDKDKPASP